MTGSRKHAVQAIALAGATVAVAASSAFAQQSLNVHDEGRLHYTGTSGSVILEEGTAVGNLPGTLHVHFTYNGGPTVTAQFTITGSGWSLSGYGKGAISDPNSPSPSFRGPLTLTGSSGRFAHGHGTGELFGVFHRRGNYALTVQTLGQLSY